MGYSVTLILVAAALFNASPCEGYHSSRPVSFARNLHRSSTNPSTVKTVDCKTASSAPSASQLPTRTVRVFSSTRFAQREHPEFSVSSESQEDCEEGDVNERDVDEDTDIDKVDFRQRTPSSDLLIVNEDTLSRMARSENARPSNHDPNQKKGVRSLEYAALKPGTVVKVQVGDLALARKAWKKRRRTGSPLLIPCSILNVDRKSMVRWNLIFLLEKFGRTTQDGMELSLASLATSYRTYLKSSLSKQATALGYETNEEMLTALFDKRVQDSYGVYLESKETQEVAEDRGNMLFLKAALTRRKGHVRTANTPLLQFRLPMEGDQEFIGTDGDGENASPLDSDALTHTGRVRALKEDSDEREYMEYPLSAALRVSQKDDLDSGRVSEGSIHAAVIFDYDKIGDGGSPLLTLSLNPGRVRENLKIQSDRKYKLIEKPTRLFKDLSVGDGPFEAKVLRLFGDKALVDLGVGRYVSTVGSTVKVLGALRFKDAFEPASDRTAANVPLTSGSMPWVDFDDEDDEDLENLIEASIDDLDLVDDEYDDDDDDEDDEVEEGDVGNDLLAFRKESSFEEGTFEEGEEEEDISHLFAVDENGELVYTNDETGSATILNEVDMDDDDDDDDEDDEDDDDEDDGNDFDFVDYGSVDDVTTEVVGSLVTENADGSLTYYDPESGETTVINSDDDDYEDMMVLKSLIDGEIEAEEIREDDGDDDDDFEDTQPSVNFDEGDEDISDEVMTGLYSTNEDGSITYNDPETGETLRVDSDDEEFEPMMLIKSLIDDYISRAKSEPQGEKEKPRPAAASRTLVPETPVSSSRKPQMVSKRLHVGDVIKVYISGVSKQSNRFTVTTNRLIQGRKVKDLKKEENVQKKKDRLKKQVGGNLKEIYKLKGTECDGTVKATSKAGPWLYVQPELEGLPVGVATWEGGDLSDISAGEKVRVRIAGIDDSRGQLSMHIVRKLGP